MTNWIKKIELANFKSFRGKHIINFDKGINVITGVNGSGKTNIIDCIFEILKQEKSKNPITNDKIGASIKLIFDDDMSISVKFLKAENGNIRRMYFINGKYQKNGITQITNLNTVIEDNVGANLDSDELKNLANKIKNNKNQQILVSLQKQIIDIADKVINVEELKQCKTV